MAKHVILEAYSFDPTSRTVIVNGKAIRREQLVLITEVTTNAVIYNFADSSLGASSYTVSTTNNVETTTIVLAYNTTALSSVTSKLMIIVDETNELFYPAEIMMDANQKLKVSTPQSLIDTDFEYGTQPTKWETISLLNNRPSAFYDYTASITLTGISGAGTRTVTVTYSGSPAVAPSTSTPIYIQDSTDPNANGWYLPASFGAGTFTYIARANVTNGNIFDTTKTLVFIGVFYSGSAITVSVSAGAAFTAVGTVVTCTSTFNHGLSVGDAIYVVGTTGGTPPNGSWFVKTTPTSSTFTFDVVTAPAATITASAGAQLTLFARPWGNAIHRPFDGGVYFTAGAPFHGNQLIRQTRRYFRYQSGKGIMFSTGSCMTSPFITDSLTSSGATVTVTTKFPHNLWTGAVIKVGGADQTAYNGTFTVVSVPTDLTFTYTAGSTPAATPATGAAGLTVQPNSWYGAYIRVGMFDNQNGFFWEYDGQTINVCRRSSTYQLAGYISVLAASGQICTGIGTQWSKQLSPGDYVVIRGMSHTVVSIESDTSMTIYPEYRGTAIAAPTQCIISRTDTLRIPQSSFNIDRLDGTGASAFILDITKIQMWMIDYSWYGAGAIRFGVKNSRGEFIFAHRIAHANSLTEAYMRSGNMPGRYEVNTVAPYTKLTQSLSNSETGTITVAGTAGFPPSGTLVIAASGNTGAAIEYISYTGKPTSTTFTGLTRAKTDLTGPQGLTGGGGGVAQTFTIVGATTPTPSGTAPIGVTYFSPQCSNTISHWGSSVIMDGRYDDDKAIQFNYGMSTPITYATAGQRYPVFSIRLAPTVDSGITGIIGARELINRMQLQPVAAGVFTTTAAVRVEIWLNSRVTGGTFAAIGGSSLAQVSLHANTQTMSSGEAIFTFIAPAGGVSTQDLSKLRDIGNSILGGGNTLNYPTTDVNKYPDGPDTLTIAVVPLAASAVVTGRLSWSEAQA